MIYEIRKYFCDRIPTEEDIQNALEETFEKDIVIDLSWYGPAHGYYGDDEYTARIKQNDSVEQIMKRLPKVYGV